MISIIHQYTPQRIVYLCYSLAYFYFMCVMLLTTLSDLPLLFFLWCRKINCCYMYNVYYYLQRCWLVALSLLFSSLFRCDSVCCFLYTYGISASNILLYILHFAPYLLPSTILCILYNTISIYSPQATLVFTTELCCIIYTIYTASFSPINDKQWSICLLRGHRCLTNAHIALTSLI